MVNRNFPFSYTIVAATPFLIPIVDKPTLYFLNSFQYTSEHQAYQGLHLSQLTRMSMQISQRSLRKYWENEDDDHWNNF